MRLTLLQGSRAPGLGTWPSLTDPSTPSLWLQYLVQECPCDPNQNFPKNYQERGTLFREGLLSQ